MYLIHMALAGIWSQVWHWGTGIGLIILCLAIAYFTTAIPVIGPYLGNARRPFLIAAGAIAIFLAGQWVGAKDEAKKTEAKQIVIDNRVDDVVKKTTTPKARGTKDPWDNPEN